MNGKRHGLLHNWYLITAIVFIIFYSIAQQSSPSKSVVESKVSSATKIPRSTLDKCEYHEVRREAEGTKVVLTMLQQCPNFGAYYVKVEYDCLGRKYRFLREGTEPDNLRGVNGPWAHIVKGSSKYDAWRYVCG